MGVNPVGLLSLVLGVLPLLRAERPYEFSDCLPGFGSFFDVLGFPCNQFGFQEPGENFEILNCLYYVRPGYQYLPNFPLSGKLFVNGQYQHPIFTFLKNRCPTPFGAIANRTDITWTPIRNNDLSWNFSKFLVDHKGQPNKRYTSRTEPNVIHDDIRYLLQKCFQERQSETSSNEDSTAALHNIGANPDGSRSYL